MARRSREDAEESILRELGGWIVYILLIIGLTYFIITFVGQRTRVSGSSMETTLQNGDNLIVDKISYRFRDPKRYDILYFRTNTKKIHIISNVSSECRERLCR